MMKMTPDQILDRLLEMINASELTDNDIWGIAYQLILGVIKSDGDPIMRRLKAAEMTAHLLRLLEVADAAHKQTSSVH